MYTDLSDASIYNAKYGSGTAEVWYNRNSRNFSTSKTSSTFEKKNYVKVGNIESENPEEIFVLMQGEMWSPKGEANQFIRSLGLRHTSISAGDIVKIGDKFFMCMMIGFKEVYEANI